MPSQGPRIDAQLISQEAREGERATMIESFGSEAPKAGATETLPKDHARRMPNCMHLKPVEVTYFKRKLILDRLGSLILILLLSPVFLVLMLLVKLTSKGPIFYVSTRVGLCGRKFGFIKFRSMYQDADQRLAELQAQNEKDGPIFKMKNDPRVTPLGRFLRKFSLDELPQLFNVLKGDMSLVGPRPPIPHEVEKYDERCLQRLTVKPGITCFWQIMGRSNLSFDEWIDLDQKYIREMSILLDLKILVLTPAAVLRGEGAY
ncbi:MAG TPA: sugar transferase [Fimbriimonadaceae bacterium]|nr:sugar transferase [Fimbriimonadaceae bacterium]